jgi:hypothetical protein
VKIVVLGLLLVLAACAGPSRPVPSNSVAYAEAAVQERQWETAYRFLEDAVTSPQRERVPRAQELLLRYP